jgi:2-polyprenyl-3-methyl-5-hydroxy-6-metoxy-1,4-benzoquinol methylase
MNDTDDHGRPRRRPIRMGWSALGILFPGWVGAKTWNREYARGAWDWASSVHESAHHWVVLGHVLRRAEPLRILDVGCGAGTLLPLLERIGFLSYHGIDLSNEALKRMRSKPGDDSRVEQADARTFSTDARYDMIVFDESLYYLQQPVRQLVRYWQFLRHDGELIVSMFDSVPTRLLWWRIGRVFVTQEGTVVSNREGQRWQIRRLALRTISMSGAGAP